MPPIMFSVRITNETNKVFRNEEIYYRFLNICTKQLRRTESERYSKILLIKKKNNKKTKISESGTLGLIQIFLYGKFIYNCNIFFVDFLKNLGFS